MEIQQQIQQQKSKREILKGKVVALVKDFVTSEGGISQNDLWELFGFHRDHEVAASLAQLHLFYK